ncbi:MAG: hypothetical protein ACK5JT_13745 [Hyphomicrobiaceae bacterium]
MAIHLKATATQTIARSACRCSPTPVLQAIQSGEACHAYFLSAKQATHDNQAKPSAARLEIVHRINADGPLSNTEHLQIIITKQIIDRTPASPSQLGTPLALFGMNCTAA